MDHHNNQQGARDVEQCSARIDRASQHPVQLHTFTQVLFWHWSTPQLKNILLEER
jgi:hypothetical protein